MNTIYFYAMKKLVLICGIFAFVTIGFSQDNYDVNGETLQLKTEIEGTLDLLWNVTDGNYRYFVRSSNGSITELKNTKNSDNKFQEEYKTTLSALTNGQSTKQLKLTLYSLKNFIDNYNLSVDSAYISTISRTNMQARLAFFGGFTNNPFVDNPGNSFAPLISGEFEFYEANVLPNHSGFVQIRHSFEAGDLDYSTTEFALGYRYRFYNTSNISLFGQVKLATLNLTSITIEDGDNNSTKINDTALDIPFIFGIGADIKVGENSYLSIIYGELFALLSENKNGFSADISVGYRFNL